MINKFKAYFAQAKLIESLTNENARLKDQNAKVLLSHNKLRKVTEGMVKDIKPAANKATDEQILTAWNSGIPEESRTTDINVALRGCRKTMNAISLQGLKELINILDEGKKQHKSKLEEIRDEK